MAEILAEGGAHIDAYYYCPHHPDGKVAGYARACDCRKPGRGLVDRAVARVRRGSRVVVRRRRPLVRCRRSPVAVGAEAVLVRTGYGMSEEHNPPDGLTADAVVDNLIAAASWILGRCS